MQQAIALLLQDEEPNACGARTMQQATVVYWLIQARQPPFSVLTASCTEQVDYGTCAVCLRAGDWGQVEIRGLLAEPGVLEVKYCSK